MQIVIDIDEEEYRTISINKGVLYHLSDTIGNAILNGTTLPEHHGRLIDADDVTDFEGHYITTDAPTIIPATKEKSCKNCEHGFDSEDCYKCDKNIQNTCEPKQTATKEGDGE